MKRLPIEYVNTRKDYILFKNDCGVTDMARNGGIYEHYIFDYIKNNIDINGKTIIDIGANFGFHTLEFADLVGEYGKVISFEPQKLIYYQLCGNIILNGYDNITAYNVALSNEATTLKMENLNYHSDSTINIGNAHLNAYTDLAYNHVEVRPLDSYEFENVAVLKIDVQGYEPNVLDGAINTIKKHKPIIFIEVELPQLQVYNLKEQDVFQRLENLGYTYKKVIEADHLVDYVAIPNETDDLLSQLIKEKPESIHDVIPSEFFTKYDNWDYVWCKNYYEWNYAIAKVLKPKTFLEIGVRFGFSFLPTMIGSDNLEYALGWDLETYGNNEIANDNIKEYYKGVCNWEIQHIDSQQINELPQFFDLINIDGCHDYECKVHDLKLTMNKCKWVTVDDYDYHSEVRRAVDDFIKEFSHNIEEVIYIPTFRGTKLIKFKIDG
jgi:FkbM family methyltransferase